MPGKSEKFDGHKFVNIKNTTLVSKNLTEHYNNVENSKFLFV